MPGIFRNVLNAGVALAAHVLAARHALAGPEAETSARLAPYLKGLSDPSFQGFKVSVAGLMAKENDAAVRERLRWIAANADAMRNGQTGVSLAATPPAPVAARRTPSLTRPPAVTPTDAPVVTNPEALGEIRRERIFQKMQARDFDNEFFALWEEDLQAEIDSGRMAPERAHANRQWLAELRDIIEKSQSGALTPEQTIDEIQRIFTRRQELLSTAGHHLITGDANAPARARALLPHLQAIKAFANSEVFEFRTNRTLAIESELSVRVSTAVDHLTTLRDDNTVLGFECTEVRPLALAARELALLPHLTMARPLWDCPRQHVAPNQVFFAGAEDARRLLTRVCETKRLNLVAEVLARNYGQARWEALRGSAVAVFDWRRYRPDLWRENPGAALELAAVAYEQGMSLALGAPCIVLARHGQEMPFDIDIESIFIGGPDPAADAVAVDSALDTALYGRQRQASDSGLKATSEWLAATLAGHPERAVFAGMGWLDSEHAADPAAFRAVTGQLLARWGDNAPLTLYPVWRGTYPRGDHGGARQLFHVMPFSRPWSDATADVARCACSDARVTYVRGDTSADHRILRRVWEGICAAEFVLVDITGLNPNVMMELGMSHALGRNTLLVERRQEAAGRVRNLEKIAVTRYGDDEELRRIIGQWVNKPRP